MKTALMTSTQITYQFTVTVNVNVNADRALLVLIALLVVAGWKVRQWTFELSLLMGEIKEAVQFTSKVFTIAFKSLLYGFAGMRL